MMANIPIDLDIHAYVDGQLDEPARLAMLSRLASDANLRQQVAELQMLKALVLSSYPVDEANAVFHRKRRSKSTLSNMVASFVLIVAVSVGWLAHSMLHPVSSGVVVPLSMAKGDGNYLVQMSLGNEADWQNSVSGIELFANEVRDQSS